MSTCYNNYVFDFSKIATKVIRAAKKLSIFIKKYQDDIRKAPDNVSKSKVYNDMWRKHIVFIQDSLKFSTYPIYTFDTFYFKKASVMQMHTNKKYIKVSLENENYETTVFFDLSNSSDLQSVPIYRMLTALKQDSPVLAVIHLQDLTLSDNDIDKGSKKLNLVTDLKSIHNVK